jgi:hypothetical protein
MVTAIIVKSMQDYRPRDHVRYRLIVCPAIGRAARTGPSPNIRDQHMTGGAACLVWKSRLVAVPV